MSEISTSFEVDRLAHELAWENAIATIDSFAVEVTEDGETWDDISSAEEMFGSSNPLASELRYVELRDALVRHPKNPMWIQIGEPNEA